MIHFIQYVILFLNQTVNSNSFFLWILLIQYQTIFDIKYMLLKHICPCIKKDMQYSIVFYQLTFFHIIFTNLNISCIFICIISILLCPKSIRGKLVYRTTYHMTVFQNLSSLHLASSEFPYFRIKIIYPVTDIKSFKFKILISKAY